MPRWIENRHARNRGVSTQIKVAAGIDGQAQVEQVETMLWTQTVCPELLNFAT